jgi:hypothetical protein
MLTVRRLPRASRAIANLVFHVDVKFWGVASAKSRDALHLKFRTHDVSVRCEDAQRTFGRDNLYRRTRVHAHTCTCSHALLNGQGRPLGRAYTNVFTPQHVFIHTHTNTQRRMLEQKIVQNIYICPQRRVRKITPIRRYT